MIAVFTFKMPFDFVPTVTLSATKWSRRVGRDCAQGDVMTCGVEA